MIKKMTFKDFLTILDNNSFLYNLLLQSNALVIKIDEVYNEKVSTLVGQTINPSEIDLTVMYNMVVNERLNKRNTLWADLPIYVSSYVVGESSCDKLRAYEICTKLTQYLAWCLKIMEDDGVAKTIAVTRSLRDSSTNASTSKDSYSETPQLSQVDFDEDMLDYRSNFDKSTVAGNYSRAYEAEIQTAHKSWDEEMKNLRNVYMAEISEYIRKIPYLIYSAYALDTMPFPDLIKGYIDGLKSLYEQR